MRSSAPALPSSQRVAHAPARGLPLGGRFRVWWHKLPGGPNPTPRQWLRFALFSILALSIYPILVTGALWFGLVERVLASEDLRVEIDNPSWSIIPGHLHLAGVRVYMNGDTQFFLSADHIEARVQIFPLVKRRFAMDWMTAENVKFQMRVQLDEPNAHSARAAAFPPLPGLPGNPTKSKDQGARTETREPEWTVALDGIDVGVSELWFMEYRYVGDGRLRGGFERGPSLLRVDTSVQDLGPGQLRFGADQIISNNFTGQVQAEIPELDPSEHADTGFFEYVIAKVRLRADLETLQHISAYLPGIAVRGGKGPLDMKIGMQKGALSQGTSITYSTEDVGLKGDGFGVKSDWAIDVGVRGEGEALPNLRSTSAITYVSFAGPGKDAFTIQLHGHEETVTLNSARIGTQTEVKSARISLPKIVTEDLDDLDTLADENGQLSSSGGRAEAKLLLDMDARGRLTGPFEATFDKAAVAVSKVHAGANGRARFLVAIDPERDTASLSDVSIALRDARFVTGEETAEAWWMNLSSKRIQISGLPAKNVEADISLVARDAEPILEALDELGTIPGIVADLVKLKNLKVFAKFRKQGDTIDVRLDNLESQVIDFSGRIYQSPKQQRTALLIGGRTISLGIEIADDHSGFQVMAGPGWLNERLSHFPGPKQVVASDKP